MEATAESIRELCAHLVDITWNDGDDDQVSFYTVLGDYAAHVSIRPLSIHHEAGAVNTVSITLVFCYDDLNPVNMRPHLEGERSESFRTFDEMEIWGHVTYCDVSDEVTMLSLQRYEPVSDSEIQADLEDPGNSHLLNMIRFMIEEWKNMRELLILLTDHAGSEQDIQEQVILLMSATEGQC